MQTVEETAEEFGVSYATILRWIRKKYLRAHRNTPTSPYEIPAGQRREKLMENLGQ